MVVANIGMTRHILIWVWYLRLRWNANEHKPTAIKPQ